MLYIINLFNSYTAFKLFLPQNPRHGDLSPSDFRHDLEKIIFESLDNRVEYLTFTTYLIYNREARRQAT